MIPPHGGTLVSLLVSPERAVELRRDSIDLPSWHLTPRQLCDFELLANGGFSPLTGFLTRSDYGSVLRAMRLGDGPLWPIPVTLGVSKEVAAAAERAGRLILRDAEGAILGLVYVEDVWEPDRETEAAWVYSADPASGRAPLAAHPGVEALMQEPGDFYVGGRVEAAALPEHFDFREQRHTPAELRAEFARRGWNRVVAFQTRNPMHRAHYELTRRALESAWESGERGAGNGERAAALLIHPAVGPTKVGDVDHHTRVRCYRALLPRYPQGRVMLSLLPLAMRLAGPREALWHAIIRQNYGCSHFIVGRDHAGPGGVYEPFAAQQTVGRYAADLAIQVVPFDELVYEPGRGGYVPASEASRRALRLSGTELRRRLAKGGEIPEWFTFPEVAAELRRRYDGPPQPGLTVFLTGLPGSGKSTLAKALAARLVESDGRPVTLLDGDVLRKTLSADLGFSKADRDENIRRIGRRAAEITREGGIAICSAIAPFDAVRKEVRRMVEEVGGFVLVYVATPLEVCEARDRKALYAKARAGALRQVTGISDPYEVPPDSEVVVDGGRVSPAAAAAVVMKAIG